MSKIANAGKCGIALEWYHNFADDLPQSGIQPLNLQGNYTVLFLYHHFIDHVIN